VRLSLLESMSLAQQETIECPGNHSAAQSVMWYGSDAQALLASPASSSFGTVDELVIASAAVQHNQGLVTAWEKSD
jgi:hypothetical protein